MVIEWLVGDATLRRWFTLVNYRSRAHITRMREANILYRMEMGIKI